MQEDELVIDKDNFAEYFFDARRFKPKPGEILTKFRAIAVFGEGPEKRYIIQVLKSDKVMQAAMVMRNMHCAREPDCFRICREICEDLLSGLSEADVEKKPHEFVLEALYYTKKEYVPKNDPHWETIQLAEWDKETGTLKCRIEL